MMDTRPRVGESSSWDDMPFVPPPVHFGCKLRRAAVDLTCLVGTTVANIAKIFASHRNPVAPQKVLVIRRGGLGDLLMTTPLLRSLREHFPTATIWVLTSRQAVTALNDCPWVDKVLEVPSAKKDWLRLLRNLRRERIDTALVLHRFFAASLVAFGAGIPQRLGFRWKNHGFALTGSIPFSPARSQTLQIAQLLTLLGKPAADPRMEVTVSDEAIRCARETLAGWGSDPRKPLVGIHPGGAETAGSSDLARRWLPERFGQLADRLVQDAGAQVVILQGPGDQPFVDETLRNMRARALGIASGLPLAVFTALLKECDLVVVNDTGPMHLAAAQEVPVVAIFGPSHPAYNSPRGKIHSIIWAGAHCSPCFQPEEFIYGTRRDGKKTFECWRSTHECMVNITAEEVYDVVVRQIQTFGDKPLNVATQGLAELKPHATGTRTV